MGDENEWELSKENVQPIRQGRNFSNLSAGLQSSEDQLAQLRKEKQEFEAELRTYSGEDPLEVWHRYLIWTEQNFVKGGRENNLEKLLESYLKKFAEETKYHNDPRYVSAWIRYANMCKEPWDIFNYLYDKKIGCELSCLYESWAWVLEQIGNIKKANLVYQDGIKKGAEPLDVLERKHKNFQMRVAQGLAGKVMDDAPQESIEQRAALGHLKTGRNNSVPVNRLEATKSKSRGLGLQPVKPSQVGQTFQVFNDENQNPSLPGQQGDWSDVPTRTVINKENEKKAGAWTKAKVPCKAVAPPTTPSFSLYVEENADQPMMTPRKLPEVGNQVLSARKPSKPVDNLHNVKTEQTDPTQRPMYAKDKVYCGAEEYSLEEIRAARWFAKKKREDEKRRLEEEKKLYEEQREQLRRNQQLLQQEAEAFRLRQQTLQQEHQAILEQCKSEVLRQQEEFRREREMMIQQQKELLAKEIEDRMNAGLAATGGNRDKITSKQLCFEKNGSSKNSKSEITSPQNRLLETSTVKSSPQNENLHQSTVADRSCLKSTALQQNENISFRGRQTTLEEQNENLQKSALTNRSSLMSAGLQQNENLSFRGNRSTPEVPNTSYRTPNNRSLNISGGPHSGGRQSLSAPSPTVNTKEAMQLVMGMFNASLAIDANLGWEDEDDMVTGPPQVQQPSSAAPFSVFNDEQHSKESKAPFSIFNDEQKPQSSKAAFSIFNDEQKPQASKAPFSIFNDEQKPQSSKAAFSIFNDEQKPQSSKAPFSLFNDEEMDTGQAENYRNDENKVPSDFVVQRRKGLGSGQSISKENVESMDYEGRMEYIESQARDDLTICPIGTNQSFSAAARIASTPFTRGKPLDPLNDVSRINSVESTEGKSSIQAYSDSQSCFQTSKEEVKDLSPIMEGSNEESSGHHGQSTANSVFFKSQPAVMETDALTVPSFEDLNQSAHVIDTTQYIPSQSCQSQLKPRNPFDENDIDRFLKTLSPPLSSRENYYERDELMPDVQMDSMLEIGNDLYIAYELVGKGGYAKVYRITAFDLDEESPKEQLALKVQSPPCPWEFYICNEIHDRLTQMNNTVDVRPSMMCAKKGYFFNNSSCILTDYHPQGNLLDLVNKLNQCNASVGEPLAMYVTIEMLYMVEYLHKCQIIHGDIKPDNFLFVDIPKLVESTDPNVVFGGDNRCVQLIDFGQSIDMSRYPAGTTFNAKVKTSGFQCIEMKTDRPWTYQTDLFGLVGTIHVLLFRKYMQIYQSNGEWRITSSFIRAWNVTLWKKLFYECLNIPSCEHLPDISKIRREFEDYFINNLLDKYNSIQSVLSYKLL